MAIRKSRDVDEQIAALQMEERVSEAREVGWVRLRHFLEERVFSRARCGVTFGLSFNEGQSRGGWAHATRIVRIKINENKVEVLSRMRLKRLLI